VCIYMYLYIYIYIYIEKRRRSEQADLEGVDGLFEVGVGRGHTRDHPRPLGGLFKS